MSLHRRGRRWPLAAPAGDATTRRLWALVCHGSCPWRSVMA